MPPTKTTSVVTLLLGAFFIGHFHNAGGEQPAELSVDLSPAVKISHDYPFVQSGVTYRTTNNVDVKLDVYEPRVNENPEQRSVRPTLIFIHGGGWLAAANANEFQLFFLPFLQLNWTVVNVDYRPSSVALAPAAVEDCLCAMRWVIRNSSKYGIDTKQMVVMGNSVGGHLALALGLIPLSNSGLGGPCTQEDAADPIVPDSVKPAAIVNWYGIADVTDLIEGKNQRRWAVLWLGNQPDKESIARSVSPLTYVRSGVPPVITIHGDRDPEVPYSQSVRLHAALTKAGVMNKLVTIHDGGHNDFSVEATENAYVQIFKFLEEVGITVRPQ